MQTGSPTRKSWRRRIAIAVLVLVFGMISLGVFVWWTFRGPLNTQEKALVGVWSYRWDDMPKNLGLEYEFRSDRTCIIRNVDPTTGKEVYENNTTWRCSDDQLIVYLPGARAGLHRLVPWGGRIREISQLTPDGEGKYRYSGKIDLPGQQTIHGTMTRVAPQP